MTSNCQFNPLPLKIVIKFNLSSLSVLAQATVSLELRQLFFCRSNSNLNLSPEFEIQVHQGLPLRTLP